MSKDRNENFNNQNLKGKKGEAFVKKYLESRKYTVTDVTDRKKYQDKDTDFLIERNRNKQTLEVKSDSRMCETGNLLVEIGRFVPHNKSRWGKIGHSEVGWLTKCKAEILAVLDTENRIIYFIDFDEVKSFIVKHGKRIKFWDNHDKCYIDAYIYPIDLLQENPNIEIHKRYVH